MKITLAKAWHGTTMGDAVLLDARRASLPLSLEVRAQVREGDATWTVWAQIGGEAPAGGAGRFKINRGREFEAAPVAWEFPPSPNTDRVWALLTGSWWGRATEIASALCYPIRVEAGGRFEATSSHRSLRVTPPLPAPLPTGDPVHVPRLAARWLVRLAPGRNDRVLVYRLEDGRTLFRAPLGSVVVDPWKPQNPVPDTDKMVLDTNPRHWRIRLSQRDVALLAKRLAPSARKRLDLPPVVEIREKGGLAEIDGLAYGRAEKLRDGDGGDAERVGLDPAYLLAALDTRIQAVIETGVDRFTPVVVYAGDARTIVAPKVTR